MTGNTTDLMSQGDGMFVVREGNEQLYTRAGAFNFDETGTLVTTSCKRVQRYALGAAGRPTSTFVDVTMKPDNLSPDVPDGVRLTLNARGMNRLTMCDVS